MSLMNNRNETDRTRESCKWKPMKSNLEDKNYNLSKTWETEGKAWENKGKKSGTKTLTKCTVFLVIISRKVSKKIRLIGQNGEQKSKLRILFCVVILTAL